MPLQIPAKLLVVVTGILSTAASFAGGIILYFEGLALLERTIEEGSISDQSSLTTVLSSKIVDTRRMANINANIVRSYTSAQQSPEAFSQWAFSSLVYQVYGTELYTLATHILPLTNMRTNTSSLINLAWYDPLANNSRMYMFGHWNGTSEAGCGDPCISAREVDPVTGTMKGVVYTYKDDLHLQLTDITGLWRGWEDGEVTFWRKPRVWYSADNTHAMYFVFVKILPRMDHVPLFNNRLVVVMSFLLSETLQRAVESFATHAAVVVVSYSSRDYVFATNFGVRTSKDGCNNGMADVSECLLYTHDLPADYARNADILKYTATRRFIRANNYWLVRTEIFEPSERDLLDGMSLLWMRSTGSVEDELDRALAFFIFFVVLVIVLDVVIGVSEVLLFARPLCRLSESVLAIRYLELDLLDRQLEEVLGCVQVSELASLVAGVRFASLSLREYRSYLPQTVFQGDGEEEEKDASRPSEGKSSHSSLSSLAENLGLQVEQCIAIVAVFEASFKGMAIHSLGLNHSRWLQVMQDRQQAYKGTIQRIMGERVLVTWLRGKLLGWAAKAVHFSNEVVRDSNVPIPTRVGISGGPTIVGKMGTATLRAFNLVGEREPLASMLVGLNEVFATRILVDGTIASNLTVSSNLPHRPVDRIMTPYSPKPVLVFQVLDSVPDDDVWMYSVSSDSEEMYTKAWSALMEGLYAKAIEQLEALCTSPSSSNIQFPTIQALIARIRKFVQTPNHSPEYMSAFTDFSLIPSVRTPPVPT